jgi:hypothetical protein
MKLKKVIYLVATALAFASCDNIDNSDRTIFVKPAEAARAVLVEDFTGQRCINCPSAAEVIDTLMQQYGADKVIAVGIHSGPLAVYPTSKVLGLRTAIGDEYYTHWGVESEPSGLIDRKGGVQNRDQWATLVYNEIQQKAPVALSADVSYDEATRTVSVTTSALASDALSGKLQLWLVEDSITAIQMMLDGSANKTYMHQHVFRAAINGTWGEDVYFAEGETKTFKHTCQLDVAWKPAHVAAVAFIYNDNGVQQAVRSKYVTTTK